MRSCNPRLGRFDSCAAPYGRKDVLAVALATQETQNGTVTRTAVYSGLQLTTDTTSAGTRKYLYDSSGNLNCVVTTAWAGSSCPSITGTVDPSLITYNVFDTKSRLVAARTYASGTLTDSATYVLDALDRTLSETELHSGVTRTDFVYIGLSGAVSQEQLFNSVGSLTETKSYAYDAVGRRMTLTDALVGGATTATATPSTRTARSKR